MLRVTGNEGKIATAVRKRLTEALPDARIWRVWHWLTGFGALVKARRFVIGLFTLFACVALGLSALGLYGVLAYTASRRVREFAVRIALGAQPQDLRKHVLHDGLVMILAGLPWVLFSLCERHGYSVRGSTTCIPLTPRHSPSQRPY